MPSTKNNNTKLPTTYNELVAIMVPRAIDDDMQMENFVEMIDNLMSRKRLTKDQSSYMETLTQLVEAYEEEHHSIDVSDITGLDTLKYLVEQHEMRAKDLSEVLGLSVSVGSKILSGSRDLTVSHMKTLGDYFSVSPEVFL